MRRSTSHAITPRRGRNAPFARRPVDVEAVADAAPRADEVFRARERLRRVEAGLAQLKPLARRVLLAQRLEGMGYAEIAARENMTVGAVEKQVARAVVFLAQWIDGW
jgi:RNA polymerase sigma factor (sigma-70 family)